MRRRVLRVLAIAAGLLVGLLAGACALVYLRSELILRQTYPVPHIAIAVPTDSASIDEGRRLAQLMGCSGMCHGREGRGAVMFDDPAVARLVAPNLPQAAHRYDDATLEALIRHGVRPDGRSLLVMPAESFQALTDADLGRIIAYLRSLPPDTVKALPQPRYHFLGRLGLALGKFHPTTQLVAKSPVPPPSDDPRAEHGRYVARIVCAHCHGTDLHGDSNPDFTSTPLQVVRGYSPQDFTALLRTGVALGGRELKVMSPVARRNLSLLTDDEIDALYRYLHSLPD